MGELSIAARAQELGPEAGPGDRSQAVHGRGRRKVPGTRDRDAHCGVRSEALKWCRLVGLPGRVCGRVADERTWAPETLGARRCLCGGLP